MAVDYVSCEKQGVDCMKQMIYSQWQSGILIPARVHQFSRAAKLCGSKSFKDYSGIIAAASERAAVGEWLDSITPLKKTRSVA